MNQLKPKRYIIQKHVTATSVKEALAKEPDIPVTSVYPDNENDDKRGISDAVGFKYVPNEHLYEV